MVKIPFFGNNLQVICPSTLSRIDHDRRRRRSPLTISDGKNLQTGSVLVDSGPRVRTSSRPGLDLIPVRGTNEHHALKHEPAEGRGGRVPRRGPAEITNDHDTTSNSPIFGLILGPSYEVSSPK